MRRNFTHSSISAKRLDRARGVLLGQLVGDALGTTVEFGQPAQIAAEFPEGHREIIGAGPFGVLPGQITDDSELALTLARCLTGHGWDLDARASAYAEWCRSGPFDVGAATASAFSGWTTTVTASEMFARTQTRSGDPSKQANGALMRVSPLAIFGAELGTPELVARAREDARFSHPSSVCQAANGAFVAAVQVGLNGGTPEEGHCAALVAAGEPAVVAALNEIAEQPNCAGAGQGWVLCALRNAFHQLLHAPSFEEALVRTVMAGGDADTNGCIAGALLGAFYGLAGIPARWVVRVLSCRTSRGAIYQTTDAIVLADTLLERGAQAETKAAPARSRAETEQVPAGARTSVSHPIRVDWLHDQSTPGKVGLTFAPGKRSFSKYTGGRWFRDLSLDLDALVQKWRVNVLVCLLEDADLKRLGIADLVERARERGLIVHRFPIRDVSTPSGSVLELVQQIRTHAERGQNVVIHCEGGLGRAGTIGGCYLAQFGFEAEEILRNLRASRDSQNCPETEAQRQFIRDFVPRARGN